MFMHCGKCIDEVQEIDGTSPQNYARIGFGYTETGVQLWCNRHDESIMHIPLPAHSMPNRSCECGACKQKINEMVAKRMEAA